MKRKHMIRELLKIKARMPEPQRIATCNVCAYGYPMPKPMPKKRPDHCEACVEQFGEAAK